MDKDFSLEAKLGSTSRVFVIELQRWLDFVIAKITGAPALYRSQITKELFLGGQFSKQGLKRLKAWGVTAVVSMRMRKPQFFYKVPWLRVLHLPTPDHHAPKMEDLQKGIKFIKKEIKNKGKVYVHCWWGEGRGPTMAAAYLISIGLTPDDALKEIKKVRTFVRPTKPQIERLNQFYQKFDKK